MVKSIFMTLFIGLTAIAACPDLTGTYTCTYKYETLHQEIITHPWGYTITANTIPMDYFTDGSSNPVPDTDSSQGGIVVSSCNDDLFVVNFTTMIMYEGAEIGKQVQRTTYGPNENGLTMVRKTKIKGIPLPTKKYLCVRN